MVETYELVIILVLMHMCISFSLVYFPIKRYENKKRKEKLKRQEELEPLKKDLQQLRKDLQNLYIDK